MLGRVFGRVFAAVAVVLLAAGCGDPLLSGFQPSYTATHDATAAEVPDAPPPPAPPPLCTDAGSSAAPGACEPKFASGLNVAWVNFAHDVPQPDLAKFDAVFNDTYNHGGRVIRWWFHVNGSATPGYGTDGNALPLSCREVADIRGILDHAAAAKVMVLVSLWSFNMLDGNLPAGLLANNINLLTVDSNRQAYIDNFLKPLVIAVGGHPGLYGWEIFNEPEGMSNVAHYTQKLDDGGPNPTVNESFIQTTLNWFADAIHTVDPAALVTSGTWQFVANSNAAGMNNYYSDSALVGAGGRDAGVLNFYEVHYYLSNGMQSSPFLHPASNWQLDKPLVIGEFFAYTTDGVAAADLYTTLYDTGYAGAWAWQYYDKGANQWPAMQPPMQNVYDAGAKDINCP